MNSETLSSSYTPPEDRPTKQALFRGLRKKCPNCGTGPIMKGFLKVRDTCTVCDQELHHHSADNGPAYLTILVVGHIMAPLILYVFMKYRPEPLLLATSFTIGCVALSLFLLPRFKGMIVGIQWPNRMYGFDDSEKPATPKTE